jgi:hypothetical protein
MEDKERLKIVLKHLIEHNEGHKEDYKRWIELAKTNGLDHVAALISEADTHMGKASDALMKAHDHLGGTPESGHGHPHDHHH